MAIHPTPLQDLELGFGMRQPLISSSQFPSCCFCLVGQMRQSQKFQPPEGMLTAGLRETERHRAPLPEQRYRPHPVQFAERYPLGPCR